MPRSPIPRPAPPPTAPLGPAFTAAAALALGHTIWSTRAPRMITPTSGIRSLEPITEPGARAATFGLALPEDVVFSHTTAAALWGLALPLRLQEDPALHVMRESAAPPIERTGCTSHRGLERRETAIVDGLRVTSLADTWLDLIEAFHPRLAVGDAVMMGDAAVELLAPTRLQPEAHIDAEPGSPGWWDHPATRGVRVLRRRLAERRTFRGRRLAREALALVRPRVWSPAESYSRVVAIQAALPEPELNASIHHPVHTEFLGFGDLVWGRRRPARTRVVGEYQGREVHGEDDVSRAADNDRCLRMRDAGWTVLEIYAKDVFTLDGRYRLLRRLRSLL